MASVLLIICVLFLFLPLAKQDNIDKDLQSVLQAVEKIIDFYERDYKNLNVDGLYGLRVLEGHLGALITKHGSGQLQHLKTSIVSQLKEMREKATKTCNLALEHVKKDGESYFNQMSFLVSNAWNIFDDHRRRVNMTYAWSKITYLTAKKTVNLDEETSDKCMSELIGSHKLHGQSCDISSQCAFIMTSPGLLGYGITHQILWTMLADKADCTEKLQARLFELGRGDLTILRQELCTNNYIQLRETVEKLPHGLVPAIQDLFLEQMFVCPSLGYYEFLDLNFLPQILSWQFKGGCYGKMKKTKSYVPKFDPELTGEGDDYEDEEDGGKRKTNLLKFAKQVDNLKKNYNKSAENIKFHGRLADERKFQKRNDALWEMPKNNGRKLLVEKAMSGGCLAHKTAVASGALAMYLRYLCEPDANKLFSIKHKVHSAEPPPIERGKKVIESQQPNPGVHNLSAKGEGGIYNKNNQAGKVGVNNENGGGFEKLQMNLNKENELVNPLDRFDKVQNNVENKDIAKSDVIVNGKGSKQEVKLVNKASDNDAIGNDHKLVKETNPNLNKDEENYDYKYDDNNEKNDDDDNDDDDEEYEDEEEDDDEYPDYDKRDDGEIDRNLNQYYDDKDKNNEGKPLVDDNDNIPNDNDDDDDYNADDGYNDGYDDNDRENVHPHINARNIGHGKSPDYDKEGFEDEERLKMVKDYDDDEEDGDDYEYDDKNDMVEQRKEDETKNEFILGKPNKKPLDAQRPVMTGKHISEQSMLSTTTYVICAVSLVILFVLYRFIRKRRIRLRMGHKYFHV
ncbi:uncharacterized protein LOC132732272 [Ruditapes philippinarum]|uniref:uncharacterized protein LOC132732272 n=1 Tax=Ruditapes philippinarum TaxID=129788 RepID=UPI00295A6CBD|nr:uncharacterized protein LOC132732272 [Ruditapes philippinarum]